MPGTNMRPVVWSFWCPLCCLICWRLCWCWGCWCRHCCWCCRLSRRRLRCRLSCWCVRHAGVRCALCWRSLSCWCGVCRASCWCGVCRAAIRRGAGVGFVLLAFVVGCHGVHRVGVAFIMRVCGRGIHRAGVVLRGRALCPKKKFRSDSSSITSCERIAWGKNERRTYLKCFSGCHAGVRGGGIRHAGVHCAGVVLIALAFVMGCAGVHCAGVAFVVQAWRSSWVWYSSVWVALVCWRLSCFTFIVQVWVWHTSCRCGVHCAGIRHRLCWRLSCRCGVRVRCSSWGVLVFIVLVWCSSMLAFVMCCAGVVFIVLVFVMGHAGICCRAGGVHC